MNTFVDRFSTTSSAAELRRAKQILGDDEEGTEAMWGSEAGFGNLASGIPTFNIPAVADVCSNLSIFNITS
jgi:20S proteasome subunit beta 5